MNRTRTALAAASALAAAVVVGVPATASSDGATTTAKAAGCERSLRATLATHLQSVQDRDLQAMAPTVDERVTLIFPSGTVLRGKDAFLGFHEEWFADPTWRQDATVTDVNVWGCSTAWALIRYQMVQLNPDGTETKGTPSYFALSWTRERGRWQVVADQNTAIRS
jgi:uncharacterized protein (TIGR02246 family)